jgi:hypothetical protein
MAGGSETGSTSQDGVESIKASLRLIEEHAKYAREYIEEGCRDSQPLRQSIEGIRETARTLRQRLHEYMPGALSPTDPLEKDE